LESQNFYVCRIQADIKNLRGTVDGVLEYFEKVYGAMDESSHLELRVILNELLINAIKHGGKGDETRYVKVVAGMTNDEYALLVVEDDGEGYDSTLLTQCRAIGRSANGILSEAEIEETGRGIFIVKNLCEDFMVNEKGNKVVINKRLHHTDPPQKN
jgi:serine/threonine-protein kinase RsbW